MRKQLATLGLITAAALLVGCGGNPQQESSEFVTRTFTSDTAQMQLTFRSKANACYLHAATLQNNSDQNIGSVGAVVTVSTPSGDTVKDVGLNFPSTQPGDIAATVVVDTQHFYSGPCNAVVMHGEAYS